MFLELIIIGIFGFLLGLLVGPISNFIEKRTFIKKAKREAEEILEEAQDKEETLFQEMHEAFENVKNKKLTQFEKEKEILIQSIRKLQSHTDKKSYQLKLSNEKQKNDEQKINKKGTEFKKEREKLENEFKNILNKRKKMKVNLIQKITDKFSIPLDQFKLKLKEVIEENLTKEIALKINKWSEDKKNNLLKDSRFYLNLALNRFERSYCPERGIEPVRFKGKDRMKKVLGLNRVHLNNLEKECGVDIVINEEDSFAYILGIDPVRRELGKMTLQSLSKKKYINMKTIQQEAKFCKKELFKKIKKDGRAMCNRLKMNNVSLEIQNMMGSLRYRYSFAQNQYFHCEEVAWLCGLLNSELDLSLKDGQRAGLFHDIGKAMDHYIEGSHAVIGADFIQKNKEKEHIVHAVRAHHHDEPPSIPLAYFVIVADAISGSRPGARRFTEDSYSQKLASLEKIIDSFNDIEDAYIMSAGREMRVIVNNQKVDDRGVLELSKDIARKIEKECTYPGLIKVTVVRRSETVSVARR